MNKLKLIIVILVITVMLSLNSNLINATQVNKINIYEDKKVDKVTEELYGQINNQLNDIKKVLNTIDIKIDNARNMEEYLTYPAIRLDIDAPYFGIGYLIESKLVIHSGVSTFDVASGYSVREVVKKKKIKMPTLDVAGIVILTRDVNIDKDMTLEDAKIVTVELVKYYEQAIRILELVEKNLNNTFKEYLPDEKNNLINEYKENLKKQEQILNDINNNMSEIMLFTNINNEINTINEYFEKLRYNKKTTLDLLLSKEEYINNIKTVKKENENIDKFNLELTDKYEEELKNVKLDDGINNILNQIKKEIEYIENLIKLSKSIEEKEIVNYLIFEDDIYNKIKHDINKIEDIKQKLYKEYEDIKFEMFKNDKQIEIIDIYNYNKNDSIKEYINELNEIVKEFYSKYNVYLINNIQVNIKNIKSKNNINVYEYEALKYIYYDMQVDLDNIYKSYNNKDLIKSIHTNNKLKEVLGKVIDASAKLLKDYM